MLVWLCFILSAQALSVFEVARAQLWHAVHNLIVDTMNIRRLHVKSSVSNSYHYLGQRNLHSKVQMAVSLLTW